MNLRARVASAPVSAAIACALILRSCAPVRPGEWRALDEAAAARPAPPRLVITAVLIKPDPASAAPTGALPVRMTVENRGKGALQIHSGATALLLTDGRTLGLLAPALTGHVAAIATAPAETTAATESPRSPDTPDAEAPPTVDADTDGRGASRLVRKAAKTAAAAGAVVLLVGAVVLEPPLTLFAAAFAIATSPIWVPVAVVYRYRQRAAQRHANGEVLEGGWDLDLPEGQTAEAVVYFAGAGVDPAALGSATLVVRVADWTNWSVRVPVAPR